jgi:hypothetical protein
VAVSALRSALAAIENAGAVDASPCRRRAAADRRSGRRARRGRGRAAARGRRRGRSRPRSNNAGKRRGSTPHSVVPTGPTGCTPKPTSWPPICDRECREGRHGDEDPAAGHDDRGHRLGRRRGRRRGPAGADGVRRARVPGGHRGHGAEHRRRHRRAHAAAGDGGGADRGGRHRHRVWTRPRPACSPPRRSSGRSPKPATASASAPTAPPPFVVDPVAASVHGDQLLADDGPRRLPLAALPPRHPRHAEPGRGAAVRGRRRARPGRAVRGGQAAARHGPAVRPGQGRAPGGGRRRVRRPALRRPHLHRAARTAVRHGRHPRQRRQHGLGHGRRSRARHGRSRRGGARKRYVVEAVRHAYPLGAGHGPVSPLWAIDPWWER